MKPNRGEVVESVFQVAVLAEIVGKQLLDQRCQGAMIIRCGFVGGLFEDGRDAQIQRGCLLSFLDHKNVTPLA